MAKVVPFKLSGPQARSLIKEIAQNSENIVLISHALKRQQQRKFTRPEIEKCVREGWITEGPYKALKSGNWRVNITRKIAGHEMTCTVEIEWTTRLLIVTVFRGG
jgi:hypothetical protein